MGDIAGAVLAYSAVGFDVVADCVAVIYTISYCRCCGGGVSSTYKINSVFTGADTWSSREEVILISFALPKRQRR